MCVYFRSNDHGKYARGSFLRTKGSLHVALSLHIAAVSSVAPFTHFSANLSRWYSTVQYLVFFPISTYYSLLLHYRFRGDNHSH